MADYRFYFLGPGDRITRRADVTCADDDDALAQAKALKPVYGIEVWQDRRRVATVAAVVETD